MHAETGRFLSGPPPAPESGTLAGWLAQHADRPENRGALVHWQRLAARRARYGELTLPLPPPLADSLESRGIARLYTHQVQAIEALRGGLDIVVVTGNGSGECLCYHLPVLGRLLNE